MSSTYTPRRSATHRHLHLRGLDHHLSVWGDLAAPSDLPLLVMVHGFMDVGASFQFVVDAMAGRAGNGPSPAADRCVVAPDWRGFGGTRPAAGTDAYWFADYLGDLDALLDALSPDRPVDLLGHSMGGNVVMTYAGVRPQRIRRLVNLEGFGLPDTPPDEAPRRLAQWLDQLREPAGLKPYASLAEVAGRLQRNNPRLPADKAAWLAAHWAEQRADGQWHLRADPAHRRVNPVPYRASEAIATWSRITAPLLWVEGGDSRPDSHWGGRYSHAEFHQRLAHVPQVRRAALPGAGHMLHHDQPEALAHELDAFLSS
ncbi:alpha/beta fold hydrolase [Ideonella sp. A 288]|uniref:alpha/beta fold hydrolase n=1 Tax=Ideonella sp. A 288 TaxID=1962181 RepID=UPI000B4AD506|nr:alpha/beta hydrolase [Ideonella sp. A 288]